MPRSSDQRARTGPRRNSGVHAAILAATLELLDEVGFAAMTIEGVAAKAGVGKTTIYRWWPTKGALAGEAVATRLDKGPEFETGDLRKDLLRAIEVTAKNYSEPNSEMAVIAFAAHVERDFDLLKSFRENFLAERRQHTRQMLANAVDRGELPEDTDLDLMMDIWAGALFYRGQITGEPIEDDLPARLVDLFLAGFVPRERRKRRKSAR